MQRVFAIIPKPSVQSNVFIGQSAHMCIAADARGARDVRSFPAETATTKIQIMAQMSKCDVCTPTLSPLTN